MQFNTLQEKLKKINAICEDIKTELEKELLTSKCPACEEVLTTPENVKSFLEHGACLDCVDIEREVFGQEIPDLEKLPEGV